MLVSGFMVTFKDVLKCEASSTVKEVLNLMMDWRVSSLVIVLENKPTGIITKTDMCWCYKNGISLDAQIGDIMPWTSGLKKIQATADRDTAAKFFEMHNVHHALVVDAHDNVVGLISSVDVAKEVARDARAWPYHRHEDGKAHPIHTH
jgi:predicted transcriptional regulator